jgi:hypothetical protein
VSSSDSSDDLVGIGGGGPGEGFGIKVGLGDETVDGSLEIDNASKDTFIRSPRRRWRAVCPEY